MSTRILFLALCASSLACADAPPISAFARRPAIDNVSISPDGRYILYITADNDGPMVATVDRRDNNHRAVIYRASKTRDHDIPWCAWANQTRVLCGLHGAAVHAGTAEPVRALVFVNANATGDAIAIGTSSMFRNLPSTAEASLHPAWFRDQVVDLTPDEPDTVLVAWWGNYEPYPSVRQLNIHNGQVSRRVRAQAHPPILAFMADRHGSVRVGIGFRRTDPGYRYFIRLNEDKEWRLFADFDAFERREAFTPLQVVEGNSMYAIGGGGSREGLWELDLESKSAPRLLSDPARDVARAIFTRDRRLLGVVYESDKPVGHYFGARGASVISAANRFLPDRYNEIVDVTADERVYIVRSTSDVDAGSYHLLDLSAESGDLQLIGQAYPMLDPEKLGRLQSIEYTARDGATIPGYLTLPPEREPKDLPVVVMPHGGPAERDRWQFDYLRLFLASRGYAVVQMNYRGSSGYGWEWLHAGHQDWAGVSYRDIVDGARWAGTQGFADSTRMCILGRGFGGYAALVAAMRDHRFFRCTISIGAPTDLAELKDDGKYFASGRMISEQIGKGRKGEKADSPLLDAEDIGIPLLLIHGTHDTLVWDAHAKRFAAMLDFKDKEYELLRIESAEHDFRRESERRLLLESVENFLAKHLSTAIATTDQTQH